MPNNLKEVLREPGTILFLGAGVSIATSDNSISGWKGLLNSGIEKCRNLDQELTMEWARNCEGLIEIGDTDTLIALANIITKKLGGEGGIAYIKWLEETIGQLEVKNKRLMETIKLLNLPIVTTNYDTLIESSIGYSSSTWKNHDDFLEIINNRRKAVFHLHGCWRDPSSIIFGWDTYSNIRNNEFTQTILKAIDSFKTIVFVGFGSGMQDHNFKGFIDWSRKHLLNNHNTHYILISKKEEINKFPKNVQPVIYGDKHEDLIVFFKQLIVKHELHLFPISPFVSIDKIHTLIIDAIRDFYTEPNQIIDLIHDANNFRMKADPTINKQFLLKTGHLPPIHSTPSRYYWSALLREAGLQGPRMLAALLIQVKNEVLGVAVTKEIDDLLEELKFHK